MKIRFAMYTDGPSIVEDFRDPIFKIMEVFESLDEDEYEKSEVLGVTYSVDEFPFFKDENKDGGDIAILAYEELNEQSGEYIGLNYWSVHKNCFENYDINERKFVLDVVQSITSTLLGIEHPSEKHTDFKKSTKDNKDEYEAVYDYVADMLYEIEPDLDYDPEYDPEPDYDYDLDPEYVYDLDLELDDLSDFLPEAEGTIYYEDYENMSELEKGMVDYLMRNIQDESEDIYIDTLEKDLFASLPKPHLVIEPEMIRGSIEKGDTRRELALQIYKITSDLDAIAKKLKEGE